MKVLKDENFSFPQAIQEYLDRESSKKKYLQMIKLDVDRSAIARDIYSKIDYQREKGRTINQIMKAVDKGHGMESDQVNIAATIYKSHLHYVKMVEGCDLHPVFSKIADEMRQRAIEKSLSETKKKMMKALTPVGTTMIRRYLYELSPDC